MRRFIFCLLSLAAVFSCARENLEKESRVENNYKNKDSSEAVIVAVVDHGIELTHEDLASAVISGGENGSKNFCENSYNIVGEGHGTHVAEAFWYGAYPPDKVEEPVLETKGNSIEYSFKISGDKEKTKAFAYAVVVSKNRKALLAFDPASKEVPEGIIKDSLSTSGHRIGEVLSGKIEGLEYDETYFFTVAGCTKSGGYGEKSDLKESYTVSNKAPLIVPEKNGFFQISGGETLAIRYSISDPEKHQVSVDFKPGSKAASLRH